MRRPQDEGKEYRQMTFLKERMVVRDSEEESEGDDVQGRDDEEKEKGRGCRGEKRKGKKRTSDAMQQDEGEDPGLIQRAPKRVRTPAARCRRRTAAKAKGALDERTPPHPSTISSESEHEGPPPKPTLRRQSTMTQLVDGRRPGPDDEEPEFKPVKRSGRRSSGGKKGKDENQRTLTQMVRGLIPPLDEENAGSETDEDGGEEYRSSLAQHLTGSGVFEPAVGHGTGYEGAADDDHNSLDAESARAGPLCRKDEGIRIHASDDEDEYCPTQYIQETASSRRRLSRRTSKATASGPSAAPNGRAPLGKPKKSRFSLLSTPERRRYILPSSQSPPDSPLSTQHTPTANRMPLEELSGNTKSGVEDTPSKRTKVVTFEDAVEEIGRSPPTLRKFASTIQDSEDEGDDEIMESEDAENTVEGQAIGTETQRLISDIENAAPGRQIGFETQAMLERIDHACTAAEEDEISRERSGSLELGVQEDDDRIGYCEQSQELGEEVGSPVQDEVATTMPDVTQHRSAHPGVTQEVQGHPLEETEQLEQPQAAKPGHLDSRTGNQTSTAQHSCKSNYTVHTGPSITMKSEPSPSSSPPPTNHAPTPRQDPSFSQIDLDGAPIHTTTLGTHPYPSLQRQETQESTTSHSSLAAHQLQTEWLRYSQYHDPNLEPESSMRALQESSTSYQAATPYSYPAVRQQMEVRRDGEGEGEIASQATTLDFVTQMDMRSPAVTPKKPRSAVGGSAHTTPRNARMLPASAHTTPRSLRLVPSSQPTEITPRRTGHVLGLGSSPMRPDTLVIPSSFPSPEKGAYLSSSPLVAPGRNDVDMEEDGETQMESVEEFSIPALPPGMDDE